MGVVPMESDMNAGRKILLRPLTLALVVAAALVAASSAGPMPADRVAPGPHLQAALDTAKWIRAGALPARTGKVWPADPNDSKSVDNTLYSGTPGVVLFFLETFRSTGDRSFLEDARGGADSVLAAVEQVKETGLYDGLAGMGFALIETYKATHEEKYRAGALRVVAHLSGIEKKGKGIEWNDSTDIISGGAGTGLFFLYAARELRHPDFRAIASAAGDRLLELGKEEKGGMRWTMDPTFPRIMPNFSHGTAGVAYFLARLYQETKRREFLDAALAGGRYLLSIADTENGICLIHHNDPEGKNLFYLGWCHGPAGTGRLFYLLYEVTRDPQWLEWTRKAARGVQTSGIPEKRTPGFWNNVSQCCGSAGVAEFFLNLYGVTHDPAYLEFARRVSGDLLARATRDEKGLRWVQAEHRVQPDLLIAQTGYMQGAAGIGMWFLRLDDFERGRKPSIRFPDSPF